ncbi:hypothetical protein [Arthrobacter sp. N199823]|uniref:hypothetical protein n=1 Tax=Arthrobacter sp. N199823 TaxID=2058895 RepID=UPI002157B5C6|nr:hypothetical protein [Arthrobacter sp. N199823]
MGLISIIPAPPVHSCNEGTTRGAGLIAGASGAATAGDKDAIPASGKLNATTAEIVFHVLFMK